MVGGFNPEIQGVSFKCDLNISSYYKDVKHISYVIIYPAKCCSFRRERLFRFRSFQEAFFFITTYFSRCFASNALLAKIHVRTRTTVDFPMSLNSKNSKFIGKT